MDVLHSFSLKNIFYDKRPEAFLFSCDDICDTQLPLMLNLDMVI